MKTVFALFFVLLPGLLSAQENILNAANTGLSSEQVLQSASRHFLKILESIAKFRAAEARSLSAEGAFDLVFNVDSYNFTDGFYDG